MPEHVHLLISETEKAKPSIIVQVLKQNVARRLLRKRGKKNVSQTELWNTTPDLDRFWQRRFYDFNVFSDTKITEKLRYMHRNPVRRGLVTAAELWKWSSYRAFAFGERGPVNMDWLFPPYKMRKGKIRKFGAPNEDDAGILHTHPSKTAKSAAPTIL
jgi:putative transposase